MLANHSNAGKAEGSDSDSGQAQLPSVSLPKGGGAVRGMGEKFASNPVTGTGSMSVPIATSPGRSGFAPQLSLSYDSGGGNGPFGFGWSLSLPSITRKTDKGLPQYTESDLFILSGAEDLVPVLVKKTNGEWKLPIAPQRTMNGHAYRVHTYRPRIEGLFARIEHWISETDIAETFWRSISKDNITTWYGKTKGSRIADPAQPARIFSWLICESYDSKGNVITYEYKQENSDGVALAQAHERNRTKETRAANRYLKRIRYGNRSPYFPNLSAIPSTELPADWCFEVVFDYGEHDEDLPVPQEDNKEWDCRSDPFSSYRSTFEIRTYRLCQRVLMFHHFLDEPDVGQNCLVRSTDFQYSYEETPSDWRNPIFSFLLATTHTGHKRDPGGGYLSRSLPPLEFDYSQPQIDETVHEVDAESLENLPYGLDGTKYQWVDLDGEGLSGVLTELGGSWFYKRNLSPINSVDEIASNTVAAQFGPVELVAQQPSLAALRGGRQQLMDLSGDGQLDLVQLAEPTPGFYERTPEESWESFVPFASLPVLDWNNPNLKFVDLTGDGHADLLISEDEVYCWHLSLAEAGYGPAEKVRKAFDEEKGPRLVFADGTESTHLADLSGDGLTDLVRIRNGEVCYWPNLGYGRFGAKVTMDDAPWFESSDLFDGRRIRLADIDGSGVTDIIYLASDGVHVYFNQSGNSWGEKRELSQFPPIESVPSVTALDLLGNGTACLVWSSPLPGNASRPMRYIDLMGGQKPHLLVKSVNNLGAETHVRYAPSTKFYLADKLSGKPWITRLPFPVHVVERVETFDRISGNYFVTRNAYHHGSFDGFEREFRGFGMVEQWDTEEFAVLNDGLQAPAKTNIDQSSHIPPVLTRTWFHTGVYLGRDHVSNFFAGLQDEKDTGEYYREPGLNDEQAGNLLLEDTKLPAGLTVEEEREACRALKGSMLRQEIYALDGSEETDEKEHPYTVTEQNFTIKLVQARAGNRHTVFFTHARESINYHYERKNPPDPRIAHALTLEVDEFGNVLKSAAVGYGRRETLLIVDGQGQAKEIPNPDLAKLASVDRETQRKTLVTYTENRFTNPIDEDNDYRTPLPSESHTYELTGYPPSGAAGRFASSDFVQLDPEDANGLNLVHIYDGEVHYEVLPVGNRRRRLIEHVRTLYRRNDLSGPLPLRELQSLALPFESYKLAFTPGLLTNVYQRDLDSPTPEDLLPNPSGVLQASGADQGGYVDLDDNDQAWIPSGQVFLDSSANIDDPAATAAQELTEARAHFFLPKKLADPFGHSSTVEYDEQDLLVVQSQDAVDNIISAVNDYRVLQPKLVADPNGNHAEVAFDALGMVAGTAMMGKDAATGDSLAGFVTDFTPQQIDDFFDGGDPHSLAPALLGNATTCIIYDPDRFRNTGQPVFAATLARETHTADPLPPDGLKIQISFSYADGFAREVQKKIQAEPVIPGGPLRWVGSGWTIFNNKGKPVRQYEPFFSALPIRPHQFEFGNKVGVSPILFYDPLGRVMATLHPNHTWEKVVFDAWRQETSDVNDTVIADPKTDADAGAFFSRLPEAEHLPTWYAQREGGLFGDTPEQRKAEQQAAQKTAIHAATPTIAHFDTLGRTFLAVAHNKFERLDDDGNLITVEEKYSTRILLDIEGNQRDVIDAKGRIVMHYDYDLLGNRIHQASMEAGERWMLNDVAGKPIRAWNSRGHNFRTEYDALRRPLNAFVQGSHPQDPKNEILFERTEYGEGQPNDTQLNLRTRVFQQFDGAGVVTNEAYDFKGNLLRSTRQLAADYKTKPNWSFSPAMETEVYTGSTTYDALNRAIAVTAPDNSVYRPAYNEANLLEKVAVNLRGSMQNGQPVWTPFVTKMDYNAKGQRMLIGYENGAETTYDYDDKTFRLIHLRTTRSPGGNGMASQIFKNAGIVQELNYTFDPAGNITHIADDALTTIFHDNQQVEPACDYTYDAIYRLIKAVGREHIGQNAFQLNPPNGNFRDYPFAGLTANANDGQAMRNYSEQYEYDGVGNFLKLIHHASNGSWTRNYAYDAASLVELATEKSNRLTSTTVGQTTETYAHDNHGNMTQMPHLPMMQWDFEDQLTATAPQVVNGGTPETTYYVYDSSGQRVRKVTERQNATRKEERVYLGGFEVYREYGGNGQAVTLERETLHVMDDKQRIALVEIRTEGNDGSPIQLIRYQLDNHLGSASLELEQAGGLISYEEYHPDGTTAYQAMNSVAEVSLKRYRYTDKERDDETGFCYHGARYYAPWLAIWTAADPLGMVDGPNLYVYARHNPVNGTDPGGTATVPTLRRVANEHLDSVYEAAPLLTISGDAWVGSQDTPADFIGPSPAPSSAPASYSGVQAQAEATGVKTEPGGLIEETERQVSAAEALQPSDPYFGMPEGALEKGLINALVRLATGYVQHASPDAPDMRVFTDTRPLDEALGDYIVTGLLDAVAIAASASALARAGTASAHAMENARGALALERAAMSSETVAPRAASKVAEVLDPVIEVTEITGAEANRLWGNAFRDELAEALAAEGREVATEVYKSTPLGPRFIDIEVREGGRILGGIETKTGNSPYTVSQRAKDAWLRLVERYSVTVARE